MCLYQGFTLPKSRCVWRWGGKGRGGGEVLSYMALTGTCGQIGYVFSFVLNGVLISSLFVLNRVSLYLNGKSAHLNLSDDGTKSRFRTLFCWR